MVSARSWLVGWIAGAVLIAGAQADDGQQVKIGKGSITIGAGASPGLEYRFGAVPFKPYVRELRTPGGINVLRDAPHDHLHHHALMYAIGVDEVDFWSEFDPKKNGREVPRSRSALAEAAGFTEELAWRSPEDVTLLLERRTIVLRPGKRSGARQLTWRSRLTVPPGRGSATLFGSHYFGLGMRFVVDMDEGGEFISSDDDAGAVVRGTERLRGGRWCAYRSRVGGKPVTVAMFDHPTNGPRPATWFTMTSPFAYMSATLRLHEKPLVLAEGKALDVVYGVALWDEHAGRERIETACKEWTAAARTGLDGPVASDE